MNIIIHAKAKIYAFKLLAANLKLLWLNAVVCYYPNPRSQFTNY